MSAKALNVNDIIDRAKFSGFHFQVIAWCLLIILFDGYDLAINGVVLPLLMEDWGLSAVQAGYACKYRFSRHDVWCNDIWLFGG